MEEPIDFAPVEVLQRTIGLAVEGAADGQRCPSTGHLMAAEPPELVEGEDWFLHLALTFGASTLLRPGLYKLVVKLNGKKVKTINLPVVLLGGDELEIEVEVQEASPAVVKKLADSLQSIATFAVGDAGALCVTGTFMLTFRGVSEPVAQGAVQAAIDGLGAEGSAFTIIDAPGP